MGYGYVQAGQENLFTWKRMSQGFSIQMPMIAQLLKEGKITLKRQSKSVPAGCFTEQSSRRLSIVKTSRTAKRTDTSPTAYRSKATSEEKYRTTDKRIGRDDAHAKILPQHRAFPRWRLRRPLPGY